jgi:hypothetical protein
MLTQFAKELFQVGQRNLMACADGGQRYRSAVFSQSDIDHGSDCKSAFGAQTHGGLLLALWWAVDADPTWGVKTYRVRL